MKPTLILTLITSLALFGCARTEERLAADVVSTAHAAPAVEREPLAALPPLSPNAEDRQIADYQ